VIYFIAPAPSLRHHMIDILRNPAAPFAMIDAGEQNASQIHQIFFNM
jgi:hypothetical protein